MLKLIILLKYIQLFKYFQSNNGVYKGNDVLSVLRKLKTTRTNFKKIKKKHTWKWLQDNYVIIIQPFLVISGTFFQSIYAMKTFLCIPAKKVYVYINITKLDITNSTFGLAFQVYTCTWPCDRSMPSLCYNYSGSCKTYQWDPVTSVTDLHWFDS